MNMSFVRAYALELMDLHENEQAAIRPGLMKAMLQLQAELTRAGRHFQELNEYIYSVHVAEPDGEWR